MSGKANERGMLSLPNQAGLSIVRRQGMRTNNPPFSQVVVQCAVCAHHDEYRDGCANCQVRGAALRLNVANSHYLGYEPDLVPSCHEVYRLKPAVPTVDQRRYPRLPCRNIRACIKAELNSGVIVNLINISRGGVCFSSYAEFYPGTPVSIATHYMEGGQNIFQNGRIVRIQRSPSASASGEYAIEFSSTDKRSHISGAPASGHTAMPMLLVGNELRF
jgi:hypothetical protein